MWNFGSNLEINGMINICKVVFVSLMKHLATIEKLAGALEVSAGEFMK